MAADSLLTEGWQRFGHTDKIHIINNFLVGCAGSWQHCTAFLNWFRDSSKGGKLEAIPKDLKLDDDQNMSVLIVDARGRVWCYESVGAPYEVRAEFFAIGSGSSYALGAMSMDADAQTAVLTACRYDIYSGGLIPKTLSVNDLQAGRENVVPIRGKKAKKPTATIIEV